MFAQQPAIVEHQGSIVCCVLKSGLLSCVPISSYCGRLRMFAPKKQVRIDLLEFPHQGNLEQEHLI